MKKRWKSCGVRERWAACSSVLMLAVGLLILLPEPAAAASWTEDEAIDKSLGILGRPWKLSLVWIRTRDYLRRRARVKTGLPAYDQQVERAQEAPSSLFRQLTGTPSAAELVSGPVQGEDDEPVFYEVILTK